MIIEGIWASWFWDVRSFCWGMGRVPVILCVVGIGLSLTSFIRSLPFFWFVSGI